MKSKNIIFIGIGILLVLGAIFGGLFSTISITPVNMVQYTGQPSWYNNEVTEPITFSSSAMIDDYKFTTETSDYRSEPIYAKRCLTESDYLKNYSFVENTGAKDLNNCDIFKVYGFKYDCGAYDLQGESCYFWNPYGCGFFNGKECSRLTSGQCVCSASKTKGDLIKEMSGQINEQIRVDTGSGCWAQHKIYYKNNLIWTSDWKRNVKFTPRIGKFVIDEITGEEVWDAEYEDASQGTWELMDSSERQSYVRGQYILADFSVSSYYAYATCKSIQNQYQWQIPKNALNVTVNMPTTVNVGDIIRVEVVVNNKWKPISANLISDFTVPTILNTPSTEHKEEIKSIPLGNSKYYFEINGDKKFNELTMKVQIDMLYSGTKFSGVNGFCYKGDRTKRASDLSRCDYVQIAQVLDGEYKLKQQDKIVEVEKIIENTKIVEVPVETIKIVNTPSEQQPKQGGSSSSILFIIVIAIAVIGLGVYYLMRHKR